MSYLWSVGEIEITAYIRTRENSAALWTRLSGDRSDADKGNWIAAGKLWCCCARGLGEARRLASKDIGRARAALTEDIGIRAAVLEMSSVLLR